MAGSTNVYDALHDAERQRTMLSWNVWSVLKELTFMDSRAMQRLADECARRMYYAGVRVVDIEPSEGDYQQLQTDITEAIEHAGGPTTRSPRVFEYRVRRVSAQLVAAGWRHVPLAFAAIAFVG